MKGVKEDYEGRGICFYAQLENKIHEALSNSRKEIKNKLLLEKGECAVGLDKVRDDDITKKSERVELFLARGFHAILSRNLSLKVKGG